MYFSFTVASPIPAAGTFVVRSHVSPAFTGVGGTDVNACDTICPTIASDSWASIWVRRLSSSPAILSMNLSYPTSLVTCIWSSSTAVSLAPLIFSPTIPSPGMPPPPGSPAASIDMSRMVISTVVAPDLTDKTLNRWTVLCFICRSTFIPRMPMLMSMSVTDLA